MMKVKSISIALFIIFLIVDISCTQNETDWTGTIEEKDGVIVVKNPLEPLYGELNLDLKKDLSIGNNDDENYLFYDVSAIALDSFENIFVLDAGNHRIQKFDKDGMYRRTIGRKGQGPGEFMRLSSVFIDENDYLFVSEKTRIQIFNSSGEYQRGILLKNTINEFFVDCDGNFISYMNLRDEKDSKKYIIKLDSRGNIAEKMTVFTDVKAVQKKNDAGITFTLKVYHQYNYWPYLFPVSDKEFIYAYPAEYALFLMNTAGELILEIYKSEPHHAISRAEKDFIINGIEENLSRRGRKVPKDVLEAACQFPLHRPFFNWIFVDDNGRIYLRKADSVLEAKKDIEFDMFSKDGYYLYRFSLSFSPEYIKNGYIYDINTSEETGDVKIIRYKVTNWDQIKEGI